MNPFDENNNIQTCIPDLNLNKNPIPPIGGGLPKQKEQNNYKIKLTLSLKMIWRIKNFKVIFKTIN